MSDFQNAKAKLTISSIDKPTLEVKAQYNPKELQIDKALAWGKHAAANKTDAAKDEAAGIHLEFTGGDGRSMQIEMLFDGYENGGLVDAYDKTDAKTKGSKTVTDMIKMLEEMASVRFPKSSKEDEKRPHHCLVVWGQVGFSKFRCVIESLSTKYQMFADDGTVLRATCTLKLKEADLLTLAKKAGEK